MNKKLIARKAHQLDMDFGNALGKLEDLDTSEVGIRECSKLFNEYSHPDFIKTIVSRLQQTFRSKHSTNLLKENVIIVVGIFAASFKSKLLSVVPALVKCIMKNFDIDRGSLQQSCARSIKEIYQHILLENASTDDRCSLVMQPLLDCLLTAQKTTQSTCSLALYELFLYFLTAELGADFHFLASKLLLIVNVNLF
jgi:hypothetical protein